MLKDFHVTNSDKHHSSQKQVQNSYFHVKTHTAEQGFKPKSRSFKKFGVQKSSTMITIGLIGKF